MDRDRDQMDQDRDQILTDDQEKHSSSTIDEQRRFGGQVRNTAGNRERGSTAGRAPNSPQERTEQAPTEGIPASSADTDLDSNIERGV